MTPQEQLRVFLAMMLCGAVLGAVYDTLWLFRRMLFRGRAALFVLDLLYGVLCAGGMITAGLILQTDMLRFYTLSGALTGMGLYRASAGTAFRMMVGKMIRIGEKIGDKGRKLKNDAGKF